MPKKDIMPKTLCQNILIINNNYQPLLIFCIQQCGRYRLKNNEYTKNIETNDNDLDNVNLTQNSLKKNVHFDEYDPREEWKVERREQTCYIKILRRYERFKASM